MPARIISNLRVDIPKSGFRDRKGHYYIYSYLYPEYASVDSPRQIYIGRLDEERNKLIPNDRYFSFFRRTFADCEKIVAEVAFTLSQLKKICSIGLTLAVERLFDESGLGAIIDEVFDSNTARALRSLTGYYLAEGSVMSNLDDFAKTHFDVNISSREVSNLFAQLCDMDEERKSFHSKWVKRVKDDVPEDTFAYDVTSISSHQSDNVMVNMGYNRDKENLPQINMGIMCGIRSRLPLFYLDYDGSITDAENLGDALLKAKEVGIQQVRLVMDGGHFDLPRIKELSDSGHIFYVGMPTSLKISREVLATETGKVGQFRYRTEYDSTFAKMHDEKITVNGVSGSVCVLFNSMTKDLEYESLKYIINNYTKRLNDGEVKKYKTIVKKKKFASKFNFTQTDDGGFAFEADEDKLARLVEFSGYCTIFTNDPNPSASDICFFYREKDTAEKLFDDLKNALEANRLHTHGYRTSRGKLFTFFIALIMSRLIGNKLGTYMRANRLRLEDVIKLLEAITVANIDKKYYKYQTLDKKQKELLDILQIDLDSSIEKLNKKFA